MLPVYLHAGLAKPLEEVVLSGALVTAVAGLVVLSLSCKPEYQDRALFATLMGVPLLAILPIYLNYDGSQSMKLFLLSLTLGFPTSEWVLLNVQHSKGIMPASACMLVLFTGLYFGMCRGLCRFSSSEDSDTRYESVRMILMGGVLLVMVQSLLRLFFMRFIAAQKLKLTSSTPIQLPMTRLSQLNQLELDQIEVKNADAVEATEGREGAEVGRRSGGSDQMLWGLDAGGEEMGTVENHRKRTSDGVAEGGGEGEGGRGEEGEEGEEEDGWEGSADSQELTEEEEAEAAAEEQAEAELRKLWAFFTSDLLLTVALALLLPAYVHLTMDKASEERTLAAAFILSQLALILLALSCQPQYVSRALAVALVVVPVLVAAPVYQYFDGSQPMHAILLSLTIGMPTLEMCVLSEGAAIFLLVVTAVLVPLYKHGELTIMSQEIVLAFMLVLAVFALLMLALRVYIETKDQEKYPHFTRVVGRRTGAAVGAAIGAAVGASVGVAVGCHPRAEGGVIEDVVDQEGFDRVVCSRMGAAMGGVLGATLGIVVGTPIGATAMFLRQKANTRQKEREGKVEEEGITVVVPFSALILLVVSGLPLFVIIPIYMVIDPSRPLRAFLLFLALALPFFPITAGGVGTVYDSFADKAVYKLVGIFFFIFGLFVPVVILLPIYLYASLGDTVNDIILMTMFLPAVCCYLGLIMSDLYDRYKRQIFGAFGMVFVTGLVIWTASQMNAIDLQTSSGKDKFVILAMFSSTISVPVTVMLRNFKTHFRMYSWYTAYVLMFSSLCVVLPICLHTDLSLADRERTLQAVIIIVVIALGILCYGAKPGLARLSMFIITIAVVPLGILTLYLVLSYEVQLDGKDASDSMKQFLLVMILGLPFLAITATGTRTTSEQAKNLAERVLGTSFFIFVIFVPVTVLLPYYIYGTTNARAKDFLLIFMLLPFFVFYVALINIRRAKKQLPRFLVALTIIIISIVASVYFTFARGFHPPMLVNSTSDVDSEYLDLDGDGWVDGSNYTTPWVQPAEWQSRPNTSQTVQGALLCFLLLTCGCSTLRFFRESFGDHKRWAAYYFSNLLLTVGLALLMPVYVHSNMKLKTPGSEQTLAAALTLSELSLVLLSASCEDVYLKRGLALSLTMPPALVFLPIYLLLPATPALRGYLLALTVGLPMLALCAYLRYRTNKLLDMALRDYDKQYKQATKQDRRASLVISTAKFKQSAYDGQKGGRHLAGQSSTGGALPLSPRIGKLASSAAGFTALDKEQQQKAEARRLEAARRHHRVRTLKRLIVLFLSGALFVPMVLLLPLYLHGHDSGSGEQWRMSNSGQVLLVLMFAPTDVLVIALLTSEIATYHATASTGVAVSVLLSSMLVYTLGSSTTDANTISPPMLSPITLGFLLSTIGATLCAVLFRIVANYAAHQLGMSPPSSASASTTTSSNSKTAQRSPTSAKHGAMSLTGSAAKKTRWQPDYGTFWSLKLLRMSVYASVTIMLPIYIHGDDSLDSLDGGLDGAMLEQSSVGGHHAVVRAHVLLVGMIVPPMMCGLAPLLLCWSGPSTKAAFVWAALLVVVIAPLYGYIQLHPISDQATWADRVPDVLQGAMLAVVSMASLAPMLFTLRRLIGPLPAARYGLVNNSAANSAAGARGQLQASAGVAGWNGWRAQADTRSVEYQSMKLWLPSSILLMVSLGFLLPLYSHGGAYAGLKSGDEDGGSDTRDMLLYGVLGFPLLAMLLLLGEGKVRRGCEAYVTVAVTIVYPLAVLLPVYVHANVHETTRALLLSCILAMPLLLFAAGGVGAVWQSCAKTEAKLAGQHYQLEIMLRQYRVRCEQYRRAFNRLVDNVYYERAEQRMRGRRHRLLQAAEASTTGAVSDRSSQGYSTGLGQIHRALGKERADSRRVERADSRRELPNGLRGGGQVPPGKAPGMLTRKISDREFARRAGAEDG
jgi:hypothetical protein